MRSGIGGTGLLRTDNKLILRGEAATTLGTGKSPGDLCGRCGEWGERASNVLRIERGFSRSRPVKAPYGLLQVTLGSPFCLLEIGTCFWRLQRSENGPRLEDVSTVTR